MDSELEKIIRKGGIITRANRDDPRLVIFGEYHTGEGIRPRRSICDAQPRYFFCEGITACQELDFEQFSSLQITEGTETESDSFEEEVQQARCFGRNTSNITQAVTTFFDKISETTFVGIDLPNRQDLEKEGVEAVNKILGALHLYLIQELGVRKLKQKRERYYRRLRRDMTQKDLLQLDEIYDAYVALQEIKEEVPPEILRKAKILSQFHKAEQKIRHYNKMREVTMGKTIAEYMASSPDAKGVAVVGVYHIRPHSFMFGPLERRGIAYLAIDITKENGKNKNLTP